MGIKAHYSFALTPRFTDFTRLGLLLIERWKAVDFERRASRQALERTIRELGMDEGLFHPEEIDHGGLVASDALYFGSCPEVSGCWDWSITHEGRRLFAAELASDQVPIAARLIRDCAQLPRAQFFSKWECELDEAILGPLAFATGEDLPKLAWPCPDAPGLYRREHACVVVRTADAVIAFDPQNLQSSWTTAKGSLASIDIPPVDAVAITHSHTDHWHIPSVLSYMRDEARAIVPEVPIRSILCPVDMHDALRATGVPVGALRWWSSSDINATRITALPFRGEQPTSACGPSLTDGLRNWGNIYRVDSPGFSVMLLADSGSDPLGSAQQAIERSVAEAGPVDALLSCCEEFPDVINTGLPHYILTVPFSAIRQRWAELKTGTVRPMTLGPRGVAECCRVAGARYFLPYAHGYEAHASAERARMERERRVMGAVRTELRAVGADTEVLNWRPGDVALQEHPPHDRPVRLSVTSCNCACS